MATIKKHKFPPMIRVTAQEAQSVASMFKLYDIKQTGKIKNHLAKNLVKALGFNTDSIILSTEVSLNEVLLLVDQLMPDPDPPLLSSMFTFSGLAAKDSESGAAVLTPQDLSDFMESLGRPPASISEASLLLNSMLEYDDCAEIPILRAEHFAKEVVNYAKKNNSLKDFR
jgi:hypothetical protein